MEENKSVNESKKTKEKAWKVKDLVYSFIILDLILIIVGLMVYMVFGKFEDPSIILDQVSFTSGIISIILATVAIIYAFLQSREATSQNRLVHQGLSTVNERIAQFTLIREDFDKMRKVFENQSNHVENSVGDIRDIMTDLKSIQQEQQDGSGSGALDIIDEKFKKIDDKLDKIEKSNKSTYSFSNKYDSILNRKVDYSNIDFSDQYITVDSLKRSQPNVKLVWNDEEK
jgi:hypothetical protein